MVDMGDIGAGVGGILGATMVAGVGLAAAGAVIRGVENMNNSVNSPNTRRRKTTRKVKRASSVDRINKNMAPSAKKVKKLVYG
jgi:uncharacterized protein YcfJ